jgi:prephenate dehydratase
MSIRVAFAGERGAFAEEAARTLWADASTVSVRSVLDVTRAVERGDVDAGVVPVENSVAGGVTAAYDALNEAERLYAVAETILDVRQCLLGVRGTTVGAIRVVASHPVALAQCSVFLRGLRDIREIAASDTASAAREVAERGDSSYAAIASQLAAERYGLAVLADHVEDRSDNQTRFLGVGRAPATLADGVAARTSLVFATPNEPGALLRVLEPIASEGLNLSKLESRPTGEPWTYRFFADVDHVSGDPILTRALERVRRATRTCRVLGSYARWMRADAREPTDTRRPNALHRGLP